MIKNLGAGLLAYGAGPIAEGKMGKWKRFELNETLDSDIPPGLKIKGNYVILLNKKCIYVGESKDLNKRLKTHIRMARYSNYWKTSWGYYLKITVAVRSEEKNYERMMIESRLIERLKPRYNKVYRNYKRWGQ